jgi:hypothetical protein
MEFQSYYGSPNLLWNAIAVEGISGGSALGAWSETTSERLHSYGISQLMQAESGDEYPHRCVTLQCIQSGSKPSRFSTGPLITTR